MEREDEGAGAQEIAGLRNAPPAQELGWSGRTSGHTAGSGQKRLPLRSYVWSGRTRIRRCSEDGRTFAILLQYADVQKTVERLQSSLDWVCFHTQLDYRLRRKHAPT